MRDGTKRALIKAVQDHPEVLNAAITGSLARGTDVDRFSDLDMLLVARDTKSVSDVRAWLPQSEHILICAFHLSHYCTLLLSDLQKIDFAIFSADDPSSQWVVHDYQIIKGGKDFEAQLAKAVKATQQKAATHLNPDVSTDNYKEAVGRSASPNGPFVDENGTSMMNGGGTVLLESDANWVGTGGGTAYLDPSNGDSLLVFHALKLNENGAMYMWLKNLSWTNDWPVIGQ